MMTSADVTRPELIKLTGCHDVRKSEPNEASCVSISQLARLVPAADGLIRLPGVRSARTDAPDRAEQVSLLFASLCERAEE